MTSPFQPPGTVPQKRDYENDKLAIDFTRNTLIVIILPIPEDGDDLQSLAKKMRDLEKVVASGKSLAVATNYKGMAYGKLDPAAIAKAGMTPAELQMYQLWEAGSFPLPVIYWKAMKEEPVPTSKRTINRDKARLRALRIVFNFPSASQENLAYITKHMEHSVLPLIRAVARIEGVQKSLKRGQEIGDAEEWAEVQCLNQIHAKAATISNQRMEEMRKLNAPLNATVDVLRTREQAIKARLETHGQADGGDPIGELMERLDAQVQT